MILTINYKRKSQLQLIQYFEILQLINDSNQFVKWDFGEEAIRMMWDSEQSEEVQKFLVFLKTNFTETIDKISVECECENADVIEEGPEKGCSDASQVIPNEALQEAHKEKTATGISEVLQVPTEKVEAVLQETLKVPEENLATGVSEIPQVANEESEAELRKTSEVPEEDIVKGTSKVSQETFEGTQALLPEILEVPEVHKEDSATSISEVPQVTSEEVEAELQKKSEAPEKNLTNESSKESQVTFNEEVTLEDDSEKRIIEVARKMHEIQAKASVIEQTGSTEEDLKNLFKEYMKKYDFEQDDLITSAYAFCSDILIKSDTLKVIVSLAISAPNEKELYNAASRILYKNSAKIKVCACKDFNNWMSKNYPEFMETHPNIKLKEFLNIFRTTKKF